MSINGEVQMFYLTPHRKMLAEKFVKWGRFLAVLREHIIFNAKWVETYKMSEVFWGKLYFKTSELFRNFLLASRLSARKLKNKKNCDNVYWNVWTNIKKLCAQNWNNIFKKKNSMYEILNHLFFGPNFVF